MDTSLRVGRRHRSWPEVLKREIVAASLAPGASVSVVARHYDVSANQVFSWRKRYGEVPRVGEDITETLEVIPRRWKAIQHIRAKFSCRDGEKISQPPAPFRVTPRGWAGPGLLAMIMFEKFGRHQPLNRQAERYAGEGVPHRVRRQV